MTIDPKEIPTPLLHGHLLASVAPRPIALASTIDADGNPNLSPFSFFNVFSANPPVLIFSPARRGRDNTTKHTYQNVKEHAEVVINIVDYAMVEQMSLSSTEYDKGVDEFVKAGFNKVNSEMIRPFRVKESPISFECKVVEVKELGNQGGAGNLIICEILLMHVKDHLVKNDKIDPTKIDQVARMGGDWYSRANSGLFEIEKPVKTLGIGVDQIPKAILTSHFLTGNHLGKLGNIEALPDEKSVNSMGLVPEVKSILDDINDDHERQIEELHKLAISYLDRGETMNAWRILLQSL